MKIWFVPDFMCETILWGIKAIDLVLLLSIGLAIRKSVQLVRWAIQLNDGGEFD